MAEVSLSAFLYNKKTLKVNLCFLCDRIIKASFFPQMKPEVRATQALNLNDDEKMVFAILQKQQSIPLADLKTQSGLSNKKWDKTIKSLTKLGIAKVTKTDDALVVEVVE